MPKKSSKQWLRDHLHNFVYPEMCKFDGVEFNKENEAIQKMILFERGYKWTDKVSEPIVSEDRIKLNKIKNLLHDTLNMIESRSGKMRIIMPGRDCFIFYALGMKRKRLRHRMLFIPEINRNVCRNRNELKRIIQRHKLSKDDFYFDTGFAGTIFNAIINCLQDDRGGFVVDQQGLEELQNWKKTHFYLLSTNNSNYPGILQKNDYREQVQIIEDIPKYWKTASINMETFQYQGPLFEKMLEMQFESQVWYDWINYGGGYWYMYYCYDKHIFIGPIPQKYEIKEIKHYSFSQDGWFYGYHQEESFARPNIKLPTNAECKITYKEEFIECARVLLEMYDMV